MVRPSERIVDLWKHLHDFVLIEYCYVIFIVVVRYFVGVTPHVTVDLTSDITEM